tara:strand:- start:1170 stop:2285 length:1116 start_codon:yes stop_codon:yes gene_type:complete
MQLSERFLNLVEEQLIGYKDDPVVEHLVVYIAQSRKGDTPSLEVVGQWPVLKKVFQPLESDLELRAPSPHRRWYPLQEGAILLGVLRVERVSSIEEWPETLDRRLHSTAMVLAHSLGLELERKRLFSELSQQSERLGILVHQLRNPLAALRTYAKLLLRKLGPENDYISLVEGLLNEQAQLTKYVSGLDELTQSKLPASEITSSRLLLPPVLTKDHSLNLKKLIDPLIERASATALLQGRDWYGPLQWPHWIQEPRPKSENVIAEIIANLLENAFRYSTPKSSVGLFINDKGICVWDNGKSIPLKEREQIFEKGFRGMSSLGKSGSGLGLALGYQLAKQFGGELVLLKSPSNFDSSLPVNGNAFVIFISRE